MSDTLQLSDLPQSWLKGVLVDIDDTMFAYKPAEDAAIAACAAHAAHKFGTITVEQFSAAYLHARWQLLTEKENHSSIGRCRTLAFLRVLETFEILHAAHYVNEFETAYRQAFVDNIRPHTPVIDFLRHCQQNNIAICAVTDALLRSQLFKLEKLQLTDVVHHVVTAQETGVEKPHPRMFELALHKLQLTTADVVMIGDSWERDIVGARQLGIKAIQVQA